MGEKVKIRFAAAIDSKGTWVVSGYSGCDDDDMIFSAIEFVEPGERRYWLTAELELPDVPQVQTCEVESVEEA